MMIFIINLFTPTIVAAHENPDVLSPATTWLVRSWAL